MAREEEVLREERLSRQGEEGEERPPSPVRVKDYAETTVPMYSKKTSRNIFECKGKLLK